MKLLLLVMGLLLNGHVMAYGTTTNIYKCDLSQIKSGVTTYHEVGNTMVADFGPRFYILHDDVMMSSWTLVNETETHEGFQFSRNNSGYFMKDLHTGTVTAAHNCEVM